MSFSKLACISLVLSMVASCSDDNTTTADKRPVRNDSAVSIKEQVNPHSNVDASPMDMSYFPIDYPKAKMAKPNLAPPVMRVIYSRPHLGGRRMFQGIIKYGQVWRLGANESTEIEFFKNVTIQGKPVKAGRYVIYSIPQKDKWTIVLNTSIDSWGLKIDSTRDVSKFDIPASENNNPLEYFTMLFEKIPNGAELVIGWDDVLARLPIEFTE